MSVRTRPPWCAHHAGPPSLPGWSMKPPPKRTSVPPYCVSSSAGPAFVSPTVRRHAGMRTTTAPTVDRLLERTKSKSSPSGAYNLIPQQRYA